MELQFEYLADHSDLVPLVIQWWHTVWGDRMGSDYICRPLIQVEVSTLNSAGNR